LGADFVLDGEIFCGQTESVVTHRIEHVEALHAFVAGYYIAEGIFAGMPSVKTGAGRIRKFGEHIVFFASGIARDGSI